MDELRLALCCCCWMEGVEDLEAANDELDVADDDEACGW